ncbi:MAG: propanediol utilization protein [Pseudomonadota bacterium]
MVYVAGHYGEWLQGLLGSDSALVLVTLACPIVGVSASLDVSESFAISQSREVLSADQCAALLSIAGADPHVRVTLDVNLPPGGGAGMSTAALVALARAAGAEEAAIPAIALEIEGATDPLMLERPDTALWAPRAARVVTQTPPPPAAEIVGGFWGPTSQTDPADLDFPLIDDLAADWAKGPDLETAARIAAASTDRTTALRGPAGDPTPEIARTLNAIGYARAHTGPARALIFAPGGAPANATEAMAEAGYHEIIRFGTGGR